MSVIRNVHVLTESESTLPGEIIEAVTLLMNHDVQLDNQRCLSALSGMPAVSRRRIRTTMASSVVVRATVRWTSGSAAAMKRHSMMPAMLRKTEGRHLAQVWRKTWHLPNENQLCVALVSDGEGRQQEQGIRLLHQDHVRPHTLVPAP